MLVDVEYSNYIPYHKMGFKLLGEDQIHNMFPEWNVMLAYMYYALTYKGYAKERVLRWIDKVRQMGLDSSFIKEEISASQQYREMEELLDEIDRRLRRER